MKKNIVAFLFTILAPVVALADMPADNNTITDGDFISYTEIPDAPADNTECATRHFSDALAKTASMVSESDSEAVIKQWITETFSQKAVLENVLKCPEITNIADDDTIKFMPIQYRFPGGREITVNYETQPKILKQRILMENKRALPSPDPNPRVGDDDAIWVNVDPAWYAIMITEHGALNNFVGPDKNNTISLDYIKNNIGHLYPSGNGANCTDRSAYGRSSTAVNQTMSKKTINVPGDESEYYIAGDVDLRWVSYLEIALDVVLTVATAGTGKLITGTAQAARVSKNIKTLSSNLLRLAKESPDVLSLIKSTNALDKAKDSLKTIDAARDATKAKIATQQDEIIKLEKQIDDWNTQLKNPNLSNKEKNKLLDNIRRAKAKNGTGIGSRQESIKYHENQLRQLDAAAQKHTDEIADLEKTIKNLEKTDDVKLYQQTNKNLKEMEKTLDSLRALRGLGKIEQTGNVIARTAKKTYQTMKALRTTLKAINKSGKAINRAAKVGRRGMQSGRINDWLFHSTRRNIAKLGKVGTNTGVLYGAIKFIGGMYDWTETSTGDFTNNIEFAPLLLLSADDIKGQENVVNHGMWLMWAGDSTSPADDDAAFLQAMDFASKFHEDLMELQNDTNQPCNIDIWVVRPIIRNPDTESQALYYLIMNDQPWTTGD